MVAKTSGRAAASRAGIKSQHRLGQHFLSDQSDYATIVALAEIVAARDQVVEIGAGWGDLTEAILAAQPKSLLLVEKDRRFQARLEQICRKYPLVASRLVLGDILHPAVLQSVLGDQRQQVLVANLPYYISARFLLQLCNYRDYFCHLVIMLQQQVAERLLWTSAAMDSKATVIRGKSDDGSAGRLAVQLALNFTVSNLAEFPAERFQPQPRVASILLKLTPRPGAPTVAESEMVALLTAQAFSGRRKTLRNSLLRWTGGQGAASTGSSPETTKTMRALLQYYFTYLGLDPGLRAENLSPTTYLQLARRILEHN